MTVKGSNGALGPFRVQIVLGLFLVDDGFAEMRSGRPTKAPHGQQFFHEESTGSTSLILHLHMKISSGRYVAFVLFIDEVFS